MFLYSSLLPTYSAVSSFIPASGGNTWTTSRCSLSGGAGKWEERKKTGRCKNLSWRVSPPMCASVECKLATKKEEINKRNEHKRREVKVDFAAAKKIREHHTA